MRFTIGARGTLTIHANGCIYVYDQRKKKFRGQRDQVSDQVSCYQLFVFRNVKFVWL